MDASKVYLVQTDTTVGFSSSDGEKLSHIKKRPLSQKILHTVDGFSTLQKYTRVPKKHRKRVRRSKQTTFIYPNQESFRVVSKQSSFYDFITKFKIQYSSSANRTKELFDETFARQTCDIIVENSEGFYETYASSIIKLSKEKITKIR